MGDAAEHMDAIYRYQRLIYDATRKYFLLGRDHLIADLAPPPGGTVLEVGCGTGRNMILAARRYPDAHVYGFDISRMMLETADTEIAKAELSGRIKTAPGDATAFDPEAMFGVAAFDRVYISYALSMIPPWRQAIAAAFKAVKPGGRLHVVDFGQQVQLPRAFKVGLEAWLNHFSVTPRPDLEAALMEVAADHGRLEFQRLYRDYAHYAVLTRIA
jgi:S-adenosylmethionine-diacylgycerolhomoserine-N-methlytransferase